jgi:uncharacterized membrane protein SpoIIM required for sporulation
VDEREFVEGSKESWERLAAEVSEARRRGVTRLGAPVLHQMHDDYRRTAADLAYAQTHFPGSDTEKRLNALVGQAHGELYGSSPRRLAALWRFFARDYPIMLRRNWRPIALSAGLLLGATALGYVLAYTDYALARLMLPDQFRDSADSFAKTKDSNALTGMLAPVLSAYIAVNNVQVAVMAFAGGMTFGALTVWAMLQNGAMLGVLASQFAQAKLALDFWALIVPHGAVEIPAIIIAGGAGLVLARALVFPGDLPRMTSLRQSSGEAVRLVLGTIPLFAIAAIVEGFFTPRPFDPALKLAVGAVLAVALAAYVLLPGRSEEA